MNKPSEMIGVRYATKCIGVWRLATSPQPRECGGFNTGPPPIPCVIWKRARATYKFCQQTEAWEAMFTLISTLGSHTSNNSRHHTWQRMRNESNIVILFAMCVIGQNFPSHMGLLGHNVQSNSSTTLIYTTPSRIRHRCWWWVTLT
jgi:hypothetical protein